MKLSQVKTALQQVEILHFQLPDGTLVPSHFHVTEVGKITKHFIDCGGTERKEEVVNFQLWNANDYNHRLHPDKLLNIIELSEKKLGIQDSEIEVEYQGETIGKFGLEFDGKQFQLTTKQTACLALDACGVGSVLKPKTQQIQLKASACCTPGGGCC